MVSFQKHKIICVMKQLEDCQNFIFSNAFLLNAAELLCMEHINISSCQCDESTSLFRLKAQTAVNQSGSSGETICRKSNQMTTEYIFKPSQHTCGSHSVRQR